MDHLLRLTKRILIALLLAGVCSAQSTVTGILKDLTGATVTSGKVTFTLQPSRDTTISGVARFAPQTVTCPLASTGNFVSLANANATTTSGTTPPGTSVVVSSATGFAIGQNIFIAGAGTPGVNGGNYIGAISNIAGTTFTLSPATITSVAAGAAVYTPCQVAMNTSLSPSGTSWAVGVWPNFVKTSTFSFYSVNAWYDWSTVVPTPTTAPAQNFVDIYSNQTIGGAKTFTGPVSFGTNVQVVPVENFGANGDWNGTTGTDNTAAIQACLNSLTSGVCLLQAKSYKISSALSIARSSVGLIGVSRGLPSPTLYPAPSASTIITTCASCDIIDVTGTSNANAIAFNTFKDFTLSRSVAPTGSAKGLSLGFVDGPVVDGIASQDSIFDFYSKGIASQGIGRIENSTAAWGYTGLAEPTGNLYGFYVDSTDGSMSNSLRIRNVAVVSNYAHNGSSTTYGIYETGSQIHDLHLIHPETSATDYGIFINSTVATLGSSLDIEIVDPILDGCTIECFVANQAAGTISVTGGWMAAVNPAVTDVLIEGGSADVSFVNTNVYCHSSVMTTCFSATGSNLVQLIGNKFPAPFTLTTLIGFASVTNGVISGNILNGPATNGILLDASTHGIAGLETNTCSALYGVITNCLVDNGSNPLQLTPRVFSKLAACSAGLEGSLAPVTDSTTATYNATVTGGGTNHVKAYCNGTNWVAQ